MKRRLPFAVLTPRAAGAGLLAVVGVIGLLVGGWQRPASAHGDDGTIEVVRADGPAGAAVTFEVSLHYVNDDDPADGATATVVAEHAATGATVGPVPLEPTGEPGHYAATVALDPPGDWQVRFSSLSPVATHEITHTVAGAPTTTAPATTSSPTTASPTTGTTQSPVTSAGTGDAGETASEDDDGASVGVVAAIVVAAIVVVAVGGATLWRRRTMSDGR